MVLRNLALSRSVVDRASRLHSDPAAIEALWADPRSRVIVVHDGRTLINGDPPQLVWDKPRETEATPFLLGVDEDGVGYFAVDEPTTPAGDQVLADLRMVGALLDDREVGLLVHAIALSNWHSTHTHCARCGAPTRIIAGGHIRRCDNDGSEHFPRTDPAVIMLVTDDADRALLGRQHEWPAGRFSTLAGFVEPGESAEQAVAREVREESGILVTDVQYAASQPWPFPSSLMLGFYARALTTDIVLEDEIAEAMWVTRSDLSDLLDAGTITIPPPVSIARRLIEGWYGAELTRPS